MRISDWSSDVCSSDLRDQRAAVDRHGSARHPWAQADRQAEYERSRDGTPMNAAEARARRVAAIGQAGVDLVIGGEQRPEPLRKRSEEHTSELPSIKRISSAVFCMKKKNHNT